jgi:hypothetical protein
LDSIFTFIDEEEDVNRERGVGVDCEYEVEWERREDGNHESVKHF